MSLAKGFFHAGCSASVLSLWALDDCTAADMMEHFYRHLGKSEPVDLSLRNAKLDFLETCHPSQYHPYYWSTFVHFGLADQVKNKNPYFWWILGAALLLGGGAYAMRKRAA